MTDAYPPFRLDMGGPESAPDTAETDAISPSRRPGSREQPHVHDEPRPAARRAGRALATQGA